jgi:DNA-binding NarL/FixJ family response regulator
MSKIEILVICRHEGILQTVVRLVNNNPEWNATGAVTDEEALAAFSSHPFKLVLLGSGIEKENEDKLCAAFKVQNLDIIIVEHYGGGSGLLAAEIYEALDKAQ